MTARKPINLAIDTCLDEIAQSILALEEDPTSEVLLQNVLGYLGLGNIQLPTAQALELIERFRKGAVVIDEETVSGLLEFSEALKRLLLLLADKTGPGDSEAAPEVPGEPGGKEPTPETAPEAAPAGKSAKETPPGRTNSGAQPLAKATGVEGAIKVGAERLDWLVEVIGELVVAHTIISQEDCLLHTVNANLFSNIIEIGKIIDRLRDGVVSIRLVKLQPTFNRMKRLAQDVASRTGRQVEFVLEGAEMELDKKIVDQLGEPLLHLLRNAVDHGIELPVDRLRAGKPEVGLVTLRARRKNEEVIIEIKDDGQGIPRDRVLAKAIEQGLASSGRDYTDREVFFFILQPGFSTAKQVSDVSGRGVGMDVVRRSLDNLGATLEIESEVGKGSTFMVSIPLSRTSIEGILEGVVVKVEEGLFIIPSRCVVDIQDVRTDEMIKLPDGTQVFPLRGIVHPFLNLGQFLGLKESEDTSEAGTILTVDVNGKRWAMLVDDVLGLQQVVVRAVNTKIGGIPGYVSGLALLGDTQGVMLAPEKMFNEFIMLHAHGGK